MKKRLRIVVKVRNIIYDAKPLQQAVSQETTIWTTHERRYSSIGASKLFNKVISELIAVDVKIDEEEKALILLSSLSQSYDYIVTTMLYSKETLILKEVMSTLYVMRSEKGQIKWSRKDRVWWSPEGKKEKERKVWAYQRHITFA